MGTGAKPALRSESEGLIVSRVCHASGVRTAIGGKYLIIGPNPLFLFHCLAASKRVRQQKLGSEKQNLACCEISIRYVEIVRRGDWSSPTGIFAGIDPRLLKGCSLLRVNNG